MNTTNNTQDQSPLIFYPKKEWLLASAWPLLCGIFLAFTVFLYQQSKITILKALSSIGSVLILLWEITFFPFLSRLLFPKPLLIVNDEGIIYQPPSVWFVNLAWNIKWEEISAMYITELSVQKKDTNVTYRFLSINPKDQGIMFTSYKRFDWRRLPLFVVMSRIGGTSLLISANHLSLTLDDIFLQIQTRYQGKFQEYAIEILPKKLQKLGHIHAQQ